MWELVAAGVAAGAALVEFAGWQAYRRAAEIAQLDQAIGGAATRGDPIEQAYRAHLLQRLQRIHGSRADAGFWAVAWGAFAALIFVLAVVSSEQSLVGKIILSSGLLGSLYLAGRKWTRWLDAQRTDHDAAGEAYEVAMVAARRSFIEAGKGLPALRSVPDLQRQAIHDLRRAVVRKRRTIVAVIGQLLFIGAFVFLTGHGIRRDWFEFDQVVWVTSWVVGVGLVVPPPRLGKWIRRATSGLGHRAQTLIAVLAHISWPIVAILWLPKMVQELMAWMRRTDPAPMLDGHLAVLGALFPSGAVIFLALWGWAKRLGVTRPKPPSDSPRA